MKFEDDDLKDGKLWAALQKEIDRDLAEKESGETFQEELADIEDSIEFESKETKSEDQIPDETANLSNLRSVLEATERAKDEEAEQKMKQTRVEPVTQDIEIPEFTEEEEETDLLKKRINSLSTSNRHLDELLSEATEEVSTISEDTTDSDTHPESDEPPVNHGLNILRLQQYERKQLADKIQSDITDVLDSNFHKLEVLSWLIRSDINRAKVTLEELTTSTSKLADHVDEIANSLTNEVDSEEPVWTLLEKLIQNYKDEHPECDISSDIDCTDYAINIPDIVSTQLIIIIQELMNNIFTHSNANKIVIKIYLSSRLVDVYINDNGVGIDSNYSDESPWYSGLHKIKEIIYLLNGTFKIDGDIVSGTNVRFSFPLE